jgi:hypothetical protein
VSTHSCPKAPKLKDSCERNFPMIEVCVVGELKLELILYGLPKDLTVDR